MPHTKYLCRLICVRKNFCHKPLYSYSQSQNLVKMNKSLTYYILNLSAIRYRFKDLLKLLSMNDVKHYYWKIRCITLMLTKKNLDLDSFVLFSVKRIVHTTQWELCGRWWQYVPIRLQSRVSAMVSHDKMNPKSSSMCKLCVWIQW